MNLDDMTLGDLKKIHSLFSLPDTTPQSPGASFIGRYCMVRTYSAGVFAGTVEALNGKEAVLSDARRIWYWDGAASLSELATRGTTKPDNCKFPCPVAEVMLTEVVEVIPITAEAERSIKGVREWRQ